MKYRKKPIVVDAIHFNGLNAPDVVRWAHTGMPAIANSVVRWDGLVLSVRTREGDMIALPGDWIIRGVHGEYYPIKPDIFAATYEVAE